MRRAEATGGSPHVLSIWTASQTLMVLSYDLREFGQSYDAQAAVDGAIFIAGERLSTGANDK